MEQEIDLRPYVQAVIRRWVWVLGTAILFALVALGISQLMQPTYGATALVAITNPRQIVRFDPRIQSTDENQPYQAYPELAESDELVMLLLEEIQQTVPEIQSLEALRSILTAQAGSDPSLLRLTVSFDNPRTAADIANTWAALFVAKANEVFGDQGSDQLIFFEEQLADAAQDLENTEKEYIDFQAENRVAILDSELQSLLDMQAEQLVKERQIASVLRDARSLQEQLDSVSNRDQPSPANQLASLLLQLRAFSGEAANSESSVPWQLQVNIDQISGAERQEQIAFLESLQAALNAQSLQIANDLDQLEPLILSVQQDKQEAEVREARLSRDLEIAEETYTALALKVEEEKITSENISSGVRLASRAAAPLWPEGPRSIVIAAAAGFAGFILAVLFIVIKKWWQSEGAQEDGAVPPDVATEEL